MDLLKRRSEELQLLDVCRKVLTADKELGQRSLVVEQAAARCAARLVDIETTLLQETSDGR